MTEETFLTLIHNTSEKKVKIEIAPDQDLESMCAHLDGLLRTLGYHYDGFLAVKPYEEDK